MAERVKQKATEALITIKKAAHTFLFAHFLKVNIIIIIIICGVIGALDTLYQEKRVKK